MNWTSEKSIDGYIHRWLKRWRAWKEEIFMMMEAARSIVEELLIEFHPIDQFCFVAWWTRRFGAKKIAHLSEHNFSCYVSYLTRLLNTSHRDGFASKVMINPRYFWYLLRRNIRLCRALDVLTPFSIALRAQPRNMISFFVSRASDLWMGWDFALNNSLAIWLLERFAL